MVSFEPFKRVCDGSMSFYTNKFLSCMFQRKGRRFECEVLFVKVNAIDNANNLVFWFRFLNKLEPWHIVYIMQQ